MNKIYYAVFPLSLAILLISSCSSHFGDQESKSITPTINRYPNPTPSPEPTYFLGPTEMSNPTEAALYFSSDQFTDGTLRLTIKEVDPVCHNWKNPIAIQMTFKNLTFRHIMIVEVPETGRGVMVDSIVTQSHRHIRYCLYCVSLADSFSGPPPVFFDTLPPLGLAKTVVQYRIYGFSVEVGQGNYVGATPEPGVYFLKFVYHNEDTYSSDVWTGEIASNQIQICISE